MQMQTLGAILNMIQNPYLYTDNEVQQNKLIIDLQALCRMESEAEKAKQSKFDIFKYVANDPYRPIMNGVLHRNGERIATSSHILACVKERYDESMENKVISKSGEVVDLNSEDSPRFPNYESVFSKNEPEAVHKIDMDAMPDLFKKIKLNKKMGLGEQSIKVLYTTGTGEPVSVYFKPELFELLVTLMRRIGTDELKLRGARRAVEVSGENGRGLLMPIMEPRGLAPESIHEI